MQTRIACLPALAALLVLTGCPSKGGEQKDAQTSSGGSGSGATGPLASLEASAYVAESWKSEEGKDVPLIYFSRENLRASAACRAPTGQIACDAVRYLRSGAPVEIPRRMLDGRTSAGVKVCKKMNMTVVVLHNQLGAEDSMCRFPGGSLVANGALEQYGMKVLE
jgi:hypothetical protein